MNSKRMKSCILLCILIASVIIQGCSKEDKSTIVTINDKKLTLNDFLYDIYLIEQDGNQYRDAYQKDLGLSYWNTEYNGVKMSETAKNSIMSKVVMYEILSDQANKKGITLTNQEISDAKKSMEQFIENATENKLNKLGLSREMLNDQFMKIALGDKLYMELANDFKIDETAIRESIKKDDYHEYKTECLFIPTIATDDNKITPLSKEEANAALNTITAALAKVEDGAGFDTILNENSELTYFSRSFLFGEGFYEEAYEDAAIVLKNDEYSNIVTTKYGYYIIHMLDNNSSDRYEKAISDAMKREEDRQFEKVYNKMKDQYDISINFDYWNSIKIGNITNV